MEVLLLKQFKKFFVFIHLLTQTLSLTCSLDYKNPRWFDDYRILVKQYNNNQYELLRDENVAVNEKVLVVCNNRSPIVVTCNKFGKFDMSLPLNTKCTVDKAAEPYRYKTTASYCPFTLIKVGFKIKIDSDSHFLETYQVCFDYQHMRTLFSINKVYPKTVARRPTAYAFFEDGDFSRSLFQAFNRQNIINRFQELLGTSKYVRATNLNNVISRGHLTPNGDFALANLKSTTFFMINAMPQFATINGGNWKKIEDWIRQPSQAPANICTGVLDCNLDTENIAELDCVVKLQDRKGEWVPMFLADDRKIPIPLWTYKILKTKSLVFLTLNNIYHQGDVEVDQDICQEIICPLKLKQKVMYGRTFCCNYDHFIRKNVPHLRDVC